MKRDRYVKGKGRKSFRKGKLEERMGLRREEMGKEEVEAERFRRGRVEDGTV